jgi:hypothetical protein
MVSPFFFSPTLLQVSSFGRRHPDDSLTHTYTRSPIANTQIYSQNGRIGIYTPAERAAIIARFQRKRSRRVWNKKIRYGCRKNLADRRLRVKGRFVKRSEQEQLAKQLLLAAAAATEDQVDCGAAAAKKNRHGSEVGDVDTEDTVAGMDGGTASTMDEDMPDVIHGPEEAGFLAPTEDQPYRRMRRYTIA